MAAREPVDPGLPIKLDPVSNCEYPPVPRSELVREAQRRAREMCDENARRIGMDRRRFLLSSMGAATTLYALSACSKESSDEGREPGGDFDVPEDAMVDADVALDTLGDDMPVIDMQCHLLEYPADYEGFNFGSIFAGARDCDDPELFSCFNTERWIEEIFDRSDTTVGVLSALPAVGTYDPLSAEVMDNCRRQVEELCGDNRVLVQGHAWANVGELDEALAAMEKEHADYPISAWKAYCNVGPGWFFDDHDPAGVQVGEAFLAKVEELGPNIVCVHKGFGSVGDPKFADPVDIGPAATAHPDLRFCIYHSGFEAGVAEGPYDPANPNGGVDRLIKTVEDAGIGPGGNVYAELGSTWRVLMGQPEAAAHVLGKLLVAFGEDNILWGTDSLWYGTPQDQIQALRAFEISEELQERFGYPALTKEIKHKIFWQNSARLHDISIPRLPCRPSQADAEEARQESQLSNRTYGPRSWKDARAWFRAEHPWVFNQAR
jgi:hypothetical protein